MKELCLFNFTPFDLWQEEKNLFGKGFSFIAGIDEAGRGPLAGPVIAAAVCTGKQIDIPDINDSKLLSHQKRLFLKEKILNHNDLCVGIGEASTLEIDSLNILQASLLAFGRAVSNLKNQPDFCLIDGNCTSPHIQKPQKALIKGDKRSFLIAAASIIAKETRDAIMEEYDKIWPQYEFAKHKGYGTQRHKNLLKKYGACEIHRKSFEPVKSMVNAKFRI